MNIRQSARGELCLMRLPGVCTRGPDTVVWSHCRFGSGGKGKSIKAVDLAGAYTCTACDAVYDGHLSRPQGMTRSEVDEAWAHAHYRSLVRLVERGLSWALA